MRKVLIIALGLATLGALASAPPALAVKKRVCNDTFFAGQTTSQTAHFQTSGGCTTTHPVAGFAAKRTCFYVDVQPGAVDVTTSTSPGQHYRAN